MKSPAFQFYPADYLASQRVQMMTLDEEGAYIRLISYCWQHGDIPADPNECARLIGKGASTTLATNVLTMFQPSANQGRMIHERLESERQKQAEWREKSAVGGRKSAEKRKQNKGKSNSNHPSTTLQPPYQPKGNTPSSSSSPSTLVVSKDTTIAETQPIGWSSADGWSGITEQDHKEWAEAYPACDIPRQLSVMTQWLKSNPQRAKKKRWRNFLTSWLERAQEGGGDMRGGKAASPPKSTLQELMGGRKLSISKCDPTEKHEPELTNDDPCPF